MNTIEGLTIRWQPLTAPAAMSHVIQSSIVGLVVIILMLAARRASARTRWIMAWIGLLKFVLPLIWFNPTFSRLKPMAMEQWGLFPAASSIGNAPQLHGPADSNHSGFTAEAPWVRAVAAIWATGSLLLLADWCRRGRRTRLRLLSEAGPISSSLRSRAERASERVGLPAVPRCVAISEETGPGVVGWFAPVVVLPRSLEKTLSGEEIDSILIHEFTHLRRRDPLLAGLQAFVVRLFWFDPVVWLLNGRLNAEMEKSCDEAVLDITADARAYAGGILKVVRRSLGTGEPGFAGASGVPIVDRVKNILARSAAPHRRRPMLAAIAGAAAVFALSGFSGAIRTESLPASPTRKALVVQSFASWRRAANFETELDGLGYSSATIKSAEMATTDLSQYSLIVLPKEQWQTGSSSDDAKAAERFDRFVQNGGTLLLEVNGTEAEGILRQSFRAIPDQPGSTASRSP